MEDDVDAPDGIDLGGDAHIERHGEGEEDEEQEEEVDEDEEEAEDEDNGKEPRTIGQGEMVNSSVADADTTIDDQPAMLPEHGQEMREHTPRPQPPAAAPCPQTPEPRPPLRTLVTHTVSGMEFWRLLTPKKPRPAAPTLQQAEAAGNISDVNVEQQLLSKWAGGDRLPDVCLSDVCLPDIPLPDVSLSDVPLPDFPRPDVPLPDVTLPDVPLHEA
jgi:hypothetical protein